jgi:hypothetical protein
MYVRSYVDRVLFFAGLDWRAVEIRPIQLLTLPGTNRPNQFALLTVGILGGRNAKH